MAKKALTNYNAYTALKIRYNVKTFQQRSSENKRKKQINHLEQYLVYQSGKLSKNNAKPCSMALTIQ